MFYLSENCTVYNILSYYVFKEVGDAFSTGLFVNSLNVSILGSMQFNRK